MTDQQEHKRTEYRMLCLERLDVLNVSPFIRSTFITKNDILPTVCRTNLFTEQT